MRKINYNGYIIIVDDKNEIYIVALDMSYHGTLMSAKCHIDYITK